MLSDFAIKALICGIYKFMKWCLFCDLKVWIRIVVA